MSAQVDTLRRFVGTRAKGAWQPSEAPVTIVAGAAGGVGTSTVAALLGLAAAHNGQRTLLVDTDESVGSLHRILGVTPARGLAALLDPTTSVADVVVDVASECRLVPGGAAPDGWRVPFDPSARRTAMRRIAQGFAAYEAIVIDAGARLDGIVAAAEVGVRRVVVVSGVTPAQIAAAYAVLKALDLRWPGIVVDLLFNRQTPEAGRAAFEQVHHGAQHFLSRSIAFAGTLPDDAALRDAPDLPLHRCHGTTAVAVHQLAAACFSSAADAIHS